MTQEQLNEILKATPANNEYMRGYRACLEAVDHFISNNPEHLRKWLDAKLADTEVP